MGILIWRIKNMALLDIVKSKKDSRPAKKHEQQEEKSGAEPKVAEAISKASKFAAGVLVAPHVTEKSTIANQLNSYVFKINPRANRSMVKQAIKEVYGVMPKKVNITVIPGKEVTMRRKKGFQSGYKKAIVFLKKGDKINIS